MIGVLVSGEGTNLQALIDAGLPISAVASNRAGVRALARAEAAGIPTAVFAASEDWGSAETGLPDRIARAGAELAAAIAGRPAAAKADPYGEPVPFEDLLTGR